MRYFIMFSIIGLLFLNLKQFDAHFDGHSDNLRLRVIANSNSKEDQVLKQKVAEELIKVYEEVGNNSALLTKNDNNLIKLVVNSVTNYELNYDISVGLNDFPSKSIDGKYYESGKYESIVITLGEGNGDNYWYMLYPDDVQKGDEIEYKLYFIEKLRGIFS